MPTLNFMSTKHRQFFISLLICCSTSFFNNLFAQDYLDIESNNIRIDPEWIKSYEADDFIWAYDVKTDKSGNVYSTGYFHRFLKAGKKSVVPTTKCSSRCEDTYCLMKHDSRGNLLWIRYANGNSRPAKIIIDDQGYIYTVGSVYSQDLIFTSTDSTIVKLDKPYDYNSGIFIAKYDSSGKIIKTKFISEGKREEASDIVIDPKGDFYLAGVYHFKNFRNRSESKNSYLLMKLNSNFETQWKQVGDTIGRSSISSVFLDKKDNLYITGGFTNTIRFEKSELISKKSEGNAFVAKFNNSGKLDWVIDSLCTFKVGVGQGIVCDKEGNAFVCVNSSYSTLFFTKIDKSGKIQWIKSIKGKSSNNNQKMLIDDKDNIYLCGEGYGAVFGSNSPELFSYKSKGATDFYFAKYNTKGELLWLKAGGGKGTDYCKSISLYKNDLFAFGWYGPEITFKDSILKSKSGYTFWLAKFDLKKLEKVDRSPEKNIAKSNGLDEKLKLDKISCECFSAVQKRTTFMSSLQTLTPYQLFNKMTGWKYAGKENFYENVFFEKLQTQSNMEDAFYSFTCIAYKPIRLMHPDNTFAVNLTPCTNENKIYELPVTIGYEHTINKYMPGFEYELFDKTAKSYLEVLLNMVGVGNTEVLNKVLFDHEMIDIQPFILSVNSKYHTKIKLDSLGDEEEEGITSEGVATIISELENKNVDFSNFILNEFILSDTTKHKINDAEKNKMERIFSEWLGNFTIENIDKTIYPQIGATLETKNIAIEISENVIRKWNPLKNKPATDKNKNFIPVNILGNIPSLKYSTSDGLDAFISDVCVPASEIAGTGILISFSKAHLIVSKEKNENLLQYYNYPLFVTDSLLAGRGDMGEHMSYQYDTSLTNFSGLLVTDATLNIPYKNKVINALGSSIIINNKLISGIIYLKTTGLTDSKSIPSQINFMIDGSSEVITMEELKEHLKKSGIKNFKIVKEGGLLKVYFKKTQLW